MFYDRPNCVQLDKENVLHCSVCQCQQPVQECLPVADLLATHEAFYRAHTLCVWGPVWPTCSRCRGVFPPNMMTDDYCHQCAPYVAESCEVVQ